MYKLFLCLRYLRRRIIAYFAILAVALCVAMMLIVVSVMNGFLDKIEQAGKGLFGDLTIETGNLQGIALYDEFIAEAMRKVPQITAASPAITTFGILQVGRGHRQAVTIAGIRLPGRAQVSDFEQGLFVQPNWENPTFDPPVRNMLTTLREENRQTMEIVSRSADQAEKSARAPEQRAMLGQLKTAVGFQLAHHDQAWADPQADTPLQRQLDDSHAEMTMLLDRLSGDSVAVEQASLFSGLESAVEFQEQDARRLRQAAPLQARLAELQKQLDQARAAGQEDKVKDLIAQAGEATDLLPEDHIILGSALEALTFRTSQGETVRVIGPGHSVVLTLVPLGRQISGTASVTPQSQAFTVVDYCRTDVWSIDSNVVYVPFETLQRLNNMQADWSADDPNRIVYPGRCSQISMKMTAGWDDGQRLLAVRDQVRQAWLEFLSRNPRAVDGSASVLTWRERQAHLIGPLEQQRTLVVIMFGVISLVAVVLILVIFFMIVHQKTKDIGVMKAVGASSLGVAAIFLAYSAMIGLVGSILGTLGGYYFVRNINPIRDACEKWFGFGVWSKEWYLFEKIPSTVNPTSAAMIVAGAILASVLGAMIPAARAGRMQPVEALRYE